MKCLHDKKNRKKILVTGVSEKLLTQELFQSEKKAQREFLSCILIEFDQKLLKQTAMTN